MGRIFIKLKVFGELTAPMGAGNDWYLIFIIGENDWKVATAFIEEKDRNKFLDDLKLAFDAEVSLGLFASTNWESRIIWPFELKEQKIFSYELVDPISLYEKVKYFFGVKKYSLVITDSVKSYIKEV